ncbi:MAG: AsnC family transcriptional regulator [Phycisphaerales bacterium]|nr:AsnC family transcriptional regulator [Planctomycetota bacterium]
MRPASTPARPKTPPGPTQPGWTFLTNHSHVLVCLLQDPAARLRDVADRIGITERAVQKIVFDLELAGVLTRQRQGRRNQYSMSLDLPLRHAVEAHCTLRDLFAPIVKSAR